MYISFASWECCIWTIGYGLFGPFFYCFCVSSLSPTYPYPISTPNPNRCQKYIDINLKKAMPRDHVFLCENDHKGNRSMKNYHHPHYHHLSPSLCLDLLFVPSLLLISRENNTQPSIDTFMWTMFFSKRPDFRENFWFIVLLCKRTKSAPTFSLSALQHHLFFPHTPWEAIKKQVFF